LIQKPIKVVEAVEASGLNGGHGRIPGEEREAGRPEKSRKERRDGKQGHFQVELEGYTHW
jgi:hypothetical protein